MNALFDKKSNLKLFSVAEKEIARENGGKDVHELIFENLNFHLKSRFTI